MIHTKSTTVEENNVIHDGITKGKLRLIWLSGHVRGYFPASSPMYTGKEAYKP